MTKRNSKEDKTIPVAREEVRVGKRKRETARVVVTKTVHERKEVVDEPLAKETVRVERVAVNRFVAQPEPVRQEGDVTIIPLYEERLVVEKKLLLREEVRITRERTDIREPQEVTLRTEDVQVERRPPGGKATPRSQNT